MPEKKAEPVIERDTFFYSFVKVLASVVFHTVMPVKCHNRERLDAEAPFWISSICPSWCRVPSGKIRRILFIRITFMQLRMAAMSVFPRFTKMTCSDVSSLFTSL